MARVRRMIHTGLPRHSITIRRPEARLPMSTSTGAPALFARSDGARLARKGSAVAAAAAPPTVPVAASRRRRSQSHERACAGVVLGSSTAESDEMAFDAVMASSLSRVVCSLLIKKRARTSARLAAGCDFCLILKFKYLRYFSRIQSKISSDATTDKHDNNGILGQY